MINTVGKLPLVISRNRGDKPRKCIFPFNPQHWPRQTWCISHSCGLHLIPRGQRPLSQATQQLSKCWIWMFCLSCTSDLVHWMRVQIYAISASLINLSGPTKTLIFLPFWQPALFMDLSPLRQGGRWGDTIRNSIQARAHLRAASFPVGRDHFTPFKPHTICLFSCQWPSSGPAHDMWAGRKSLWGPGSHLNKHLWGPYSLTHATLVTHTERLKPLTLLRSGWRCVSGHQEAWPLSCRAYTPSFY